MLAKYAHLIPSGNGPANSLYEKAVGCFWVPKQLSSLDKDRNSYLKLTDDKKHLLVTMLTFFLFADPIVIENIIDVMLPQLHAEFSKTFTSNVDYEGVKAFLEFQAPMERIHSKVYLMVWEGIFPLSDREKIDFDSMPGVTRKLDDMKKYTKPGIPLAKRLLVWYLIEGLYFQEVFGGIFYFPETDFPGLWHSNKLIARDENLHTNFSGMLLNNLIEPLDVKEVHATVNEFMLTSEAFCHDALPNDVFGLSAKNLTDFARFRCAKLLEEVHIPPVYQIKNPLRYMEETGLIESFNFFEMRSTYDHGANVLSISSGSTKSSGQTSDEETQEPSASNYFCNLEDL